MKKIPSLFKRDFVGNPALVLPEYTEGTEWVREGYGIASQKLDGAAARVLNGYPWARYDAKHDKPAPEGFEPCQDPDPLTGHWPGWIPISQTANTHVWMLVAFYRDCFYAHERIPDGTYEVCGPHFQSNPEEYDEDHFIRHGIIMFTGVPTDYEGLRNWFKGRNIEGVVWRHGEHMVKIKKSDFGLKRKE